MKIIKLLELQIMLNREEIIEMVKQYNIPKLENLTLLYSLGTFLEMGSIALGLYAVNHGDYRHYIAAALGYFVGKLVGDSGLHWGITGDEIAPLTREVDTRLRELERRILNSEKK